MGGVGVSLVYVVGFILFGILVIVPVAVMLSPGNSWRRRKLSVKDEEFRRLVHGATETDREIKESQEKIMNELTQLNKRMTSIEKILKEVE